MPHVEVGGSAIKAGLKGTKISRGCVSEETTQATDAIVVNGVAPGVVHTELCSPACQTLAVQSQLKCLVAGMAAVFSTIESRDIWVQPEAVGVVRTERGDAVRGKASSQATGVE